MWSCWRFKILRLKNHVLLYMHVTKNDFLTSILWSANITTQLLYIFLSIWVITSHNYQKYPCGHVGISKYDLPKMVQNAFLRGFRQWFLEHGKLKIIFFSIFLPKTMYFVRKYNSMYHIIIFCRKNVLWSCILWENAKFSAKQPKL